MLELWRHGSQSTRGRKVIFRRKPKELPKREIEFQVNVIGAQAMHIKRTGSYVLELERPLPNEELNRIIKQLREQTGAKWVIVQGSVKVAKCGCHG